MGTTANDLPCDGCGLPASPEHIAERVRRLELSTRFRPVHLHVLFVALAPPARAEDDFYGPAKSKEFFNPFMEALGISSPAQKSGAGLDTQEADSAMLSEFQRRGYYLTYLSECPIPEHVEPVETTIDRLAGTLIRRIRFNYRPKDIAPLGQELHPLIEKLRAAGIDTLLTLDKGQVLPMPGAGTGYSTELFRRAVSAAAP